MASFLWKRKQPILDFLSNSRLNIEIISLAINVSILKSVPNQSDLKCALSNAQFPIQIA